MAGPELTTGIVIEGCGHVYHRSCVVSYLLGPYLTSITMRMCRDCKKFKAYAEKNEWDRSVWRYRFGDIGLEMMIYRIEPGKPAKPAKAAG
jgi:hypothetical protein